LFEGKTHLADFANLKYNNYMIYLIIGIIIGVYLGWKYELAINDFIDSIKIHLNIK
jgi:hypothetical protein